MDQSLLRSYFATSYELPSEEGTIRASIDGELVSDPSLLPALLRTRFAILTAYNPRSMLLPRKVNEQRQQVLRDMLVLGRFRVENCLGYDEEPDGMWREPAWVVHDVDRQEAITFGCAFRQNTIIFCDNARPELVVTDTTCDVVGRSFPGHWRVRS